MSIGQNHVVSKLEKNSKALDKDQRLARVIAKKNKEGNYESEHLQESKCVSIPQIQPEFSQSQLIAMQPHIVGMLANAQDEIIRELLVTKGITSVNDAEISVDECIKYLDDSAKGNRITTEYMQKWFEETYSDPAMEFICSIICKFDPENLSEEQQKVLYVKTNVLRDMLTGFASPKYSPEIPKLKSIIKFGAFTTQENWDARMKNIQEKSARMLKEKEEALSMDALGFSEA